jgi:RNA polymerase sigma factor (TIGR02999 family)
VASDGPGPQSPGDITRLLLAWRKGDTDAPGVLFTLVYDELRHVARMQARRGDRSLGATGLVHEAFLKLTDHSRLDVKDRGHFFALAARAMRQVLIDRARRRVAAKRGGASPEGRCVGDTSPEDLLALDEALERLEGVDPRLARLVEMRFFAGLSVEETAETLALSPRTVKRDWHKARALLHRELAGRDAE